MTIVGWRRWVVILGACLVVACGPKAGSTESDTRKITFDCIGQIVSDSIEHYQAPTRPPLPRTRSK